MTTATPSLDPSAPVDSLYDVIHRRRDVRGEFTGTAADPQILRRILGAAHAAATEPGERATTVSRSKNDGILESSRSVVVTHDQSRGGPAVLGRHAIADAGLYSTCLAIQNLWLAATAEGWGVGWVSFYREEFLGELLGIPSGIRPLAWLCLGPVSHLEQVPDLERAGWRRRRPLDEAVHDERWPAHDAP